MVGNSNLFSLIRTTDSIFPLIVKLTGSALHSTIKQSNRQNKSLRMNVVLLKFYLRSLKFDLFPNCDALNHIGNINVQTD